MKLFSIIIILSVLPAKQSAIKHVSTANNKTTSVIIEESVRKRDLQFVDEWYDKHVVQPSTKKSEFLGKLFTKKRLVHVLQACRKNKIPPSVVLSQCMLESRHASKTDVADYVTKTNNYFGIKLNNEMSKKKSGYKMLTTEVRNGRRQVVNQSFSTFHGFNDCLTAYIKIVTRFAYKDEHEWLRKMTKMYATSNTYLAMINKVRNCNDFKTFDRHLKL